MPRGFDRQEMHQFLTEVEARAFRMMHMATANRDDALEIVQDAMTKLVQKYAHLPANEWKSLFYSILQSRLRDFQRRQMVRKRFRHWFNWQDEATDDPLEHHADETAIDPSVNLENQQFINQLQEAIETLPSRQQQVFLLRLWEGMDITQTAKIMQCSESSVKTHYARALDKLRLALEDFQ